MNPDHAVNTPERIRVRSFRYARAGDYKRYDMLQELSFEKIEDVGPCQDRLASY